MTVPAMTPARVWWSAVRPATLAASVSPVLAGTAVAIHEGSIRPAAGFAALVVALGMQVGVNFANDYSDFTRGADTPTRIGPVRAASSGLIPPPRVMWAAIVAFGGLGELFVFIFFGLVATCGTVYVESLRLTPLAVLAGCGIGFLATAILVLNNLRDIETDAAAGKRTLATRIGRDRTLILLVVLVCAAFTMPILMFMLKFAAVTVMLVHFGIPIAAVPVRAAFASREGPALVGALKRMAATEVAYALLLTAGLLA
ncbi:MAG: 1,4-dihydroxy-2-naphthoate polyprenyltransferase [Chloroflexi bacterium]|nr:MAG: 1,4-dihydroxy-2-naphthoate polyprenyltransferase [Chloroflexota bacterium]